MKLKLGMVGGGPGSFIGSVHRKVAAMDGHYELVCGAFSSNPEKSRQTGEELFLDPKRVYDNYEEMIRKEKQLPKEERMDVLSIVTPNNLHYDPAEKALQNGFHVVLDKPLTFSLEEARDLKKVVDESGMLLTVTYTYTGYPMVKEFRNIIQSGKPGKIRKVYVEYPQGSLARPVEKEGKKRAVWRTDPEQSGAGGTIGDIGTHAFNMCEFVTGSKVTEICAMLNSLVEGRQLDDDAMALLKFDNGSTGSMIATQIAAGEENDLKIRVYGEHGGLIWSHSDPNSLVVKMIGEPIQIYRTAQPYTTRSTVDNTRVPPGHPEGFFEAFANIYSNFALAVRDHSAGKFYSTSDYEFPDIDDGLRGMAFVETMIASDRSDEKWMKLEI